MIIIAMEPDNVHQHAMVGEASYVITDTLDDAISFVLQVAGYSESAQVQ